MDKTDYIPHSLIAKVTHYPANILITTKQDGLYSTKEYVVGGNGIYGEFEKMPEEKKQSNTISLPDAIFMP